MYMCMCMYVCEIYFVITIHMMIIPILLNSNNSENCINDKGSKNNIRIY